MRKLEIIPVIHIQNYEQVLTNVRICVDVGIEKVMLICMSGNDYLTEESHKIVVSQYPDLWVGCNFLGKGAIEALSTFQGDGLWTDQTITKERLGDKRKFSGLYFGGVAFKYQTQPEDFVSAAVEAKECIDVVTTSGIATGRAADLSKLQAMRAAIGDHPFAVASGVSEDNIGHYNGLLDYVLVATSITACNGGLEFIQPAKLEALKNKIKS